MPTTIIITVTGCADDSHGSQTQKKKEKEKKNRKEEGLDVFWREEPSLSSSFGFGGVCPSENQLVQARVYLLNHHD